MNKIIFIFGFIFMVIAFSQLPGFYLLHQPLNPIFGFIALLGLLLAIVGFKIGEKKVMPDA